MRLLQRLSRVLVGKHFWHMSHVECAFSHCLRSRRDDGCFEGRRVLKESGSLPESNILRIEHSDHFAHCHFQATNCCNHSHSFVVLPHSLAKFNVRMFCSLSFCARDCWFLFVFDGPTRKVRRFCLKSVYLFAFYVKRCCHLLHTGPATGDWTNQAVLKKCLPLWSLPQNQWHKPIETKRIKKLKAVVFPNLFRFLPWKI